VNTAYADYVIGHHLCHSWTMVAEALWLFKEPGALEMVQKLYLKGEPCAHSCRSEGRIILSVSELRANYCYYHYHYHSVHALSSTCSCVNTCTTIPYFVGY
jgi:hypothetical protein